MNRGYQQHLDAGLGRSAGVNKGPAVTRRQTTGNETEAQESGGFARRATSGERHSSPWLGLVITLVPWLVLFGALLLVLHLAGASGW
jgi:hypothetical protein